MPGWSAYLVYVEVTGQADWVYNIPSESETETPDNSSFH